MEASSDCRRIHASRRKTLVSSPKSRSASALRSESVPSAASGPGPTRASTSANSVTFGVGRPTTMRSKAPKPKTSSFARGGFTIHWTPPRSALLTAKAGGTGSGGGSLWRRSSPAPAGDAVCGPSGVGACARPVVGAARRRSSRGRRITSARRRRLVKHPLDDHGIAPLAVELAVPPVDADDAELTGLVQPEARGVLREDTRDQLPEPARGVDVAEGVQRRAPGAGATRGAGHVDGVLGDPGVRRPGPVRARGRPRDHAPVALDHDRRIALA